jgi:glycosyltransferase involved in cell wall biosynthesis
MVGKRMNSNKHIVWILPGFASSETDDTCLPMMLDLLEYIQKTKKITISIVTLQYPYSVNKYDVFGTSVYPMNGRNKWYTKITTWKKTLQTLEAIHKTNPIDIIHSFWLGDAALMAHAFSKQRKIQHVCSIMGQDALNTNRHLNNKRLADLPIVAISAYQAETYFKNTGKRVKEIIPFGMPDYSNPAVEKKYDIIGVGSLIPLKNYEMWIEIIELTKSRVSGLKAILVGDGEQRKELSQLIEQKGLSSTITMALHQSRKKTLKLIEQSKIFIHTSKYEGQAYVLMEAMSRNLAVLSTPVGYANENEKIWKGTSAIDFAEEIQQLLTKNEIKVKYDAPLVKDTFEKYNALYQKLLIS